MICFFKLISDVDKTHSKQKISSMSPGLRLSAQSLVVFGEVEEHGSRLVSQCVATSHHTTMNTNH